ncbi:response regulator transcription factor [Pseudomonas sp. EA_65y_Pfl1_P120]|uniref:response regulator transcription factor n=1 Tax=Pseudomonas sp. EA_65y_Pfl1_P120 TaxID=3088693 RepID=UPI00403F28E8
MSLASRGRALSRREQEVARYIAVGHTSKQIARRLGISHQTVRKHRENLYRKLGIQSMAQLLRYCLAESVER